MNNIFEFLWMPSAFPWTAKITIFCKTDYDQFYSASLSKFIQDGGKLDIIDIFCIFFDTKRKKMSEQK